MNATGNKRKQKNLFIIVTVVFVLATCCVTFILSNASAADATNTNLENDSTLNLIELEELQAFLQNDTTEEVYVYIGRESCPVCTAIYPSIEEVNSKYSLGLQYYSTEVDREIRPDEMTGVLDTIGVSSVPSVVVFSSGEVSKVYSGEEFVNMYPLI